MRPIVVSGFMGAGKTTVGRRLAARLERPFFDLDEVIEKESGLALEEFFRSKGEAAFRDAERTTLRRLLADNQTSVIALGGGTVTNRALRHELVDRTTIVTLTAEARTIETRVKGTKRPLLNDAPPSRIGELLSARSAAYNEAHLTISTDDREPDDVADVIAQSLSRDPVLVALGEKSYLVDFTQGDENVLPDRIAALLPSKIVYVSDSNLERATESALFESLAALAIESTEVILPHGEKQKSVVNVQAIWDVALGFGIDRESIIVAAGGGVIGDLGGFAAATLLRGIRYVYAPTSLVAMVDSSVGGKTALHHTAGKNLVGVFHQPSSVVVDYARLLTLPAREVASGLSELVKLALVDDEELFTLLEANAEKIAGKLSEGALEILAPLVRRAIELKARSVRDDERDEGERLRLNYGHTVGHALEAHGDFRLHRHGEAVAIGLLRELALGVSLGVTPQIALDRTEALLRKLGLKTEVKKEELAAAWHFARADKKRARETIRMPLVTSVGASRIEPLTMDRIKTAFVVA